MRITRRTRGFPPPHSLDANEDYPADARLSTSSSDERSDRRIDLVAMMRKLAAPHREVLVLREMQGLSYEEIARTLSIPRGTVESRLHRARTELRQYLTDYAPNQQR